MDTRNRPSHEQLAILLVLLYSIILVTAVFFPQSAARDVLPYVSALLALAIRAFFTNKKD